MPITYRDDSIVPGDIIVPQAPDEPDVSFGKMFGAAMRLNNSVAAAAAREGGGNTLRGAQTPIDLAFDPFTEIEGTEYEPWAESFVNANSHEDVMRTMRNIDREMEDRRTLDSSGVGGIAASIASGVIDPLFLITAAIPGGAALRTASVAKGAAIGGGAAVAGEVATEIGLHAVQETRTSIESAFNITAAALLGGALGGAAAILTKREFKDLAQSIADDFDEPVVSAARGGDSAGAAARVETTLEDETLAGSNYAMKALNKVLPDWLESPARRMALSPARSTRVALQELADTPWIWKKNLGRVDHDGNPLPPAASPQSIENLVKAWDGAKWKGRQIQDTQYAAYRKRMKGQDAMSMKAFREQVGRAMRRNNRHEIPEVSATSAAWRKQVFEPLKVKAIENKLLPEDVQVVGAESYLTRVYKHGQIRLRRGEFSTILQRWVRGQINEAEIAKLAKAADDIQPGSGPAVSRQFKADDFSAGAMSDAEISDIADEIIDNILGHRSLMNMDVVPKAGPLKDRVLRIPDEEIEDFLYSDIDIVSSDYVRQMAPEVELTARYGDRTAEQLVTNIRSEYAQLMEGATGRKLASLTNRMDKDIADVLALRDMLLGTYGRPSNAGSSVTQFGRAFRDFNFVRMLGGMTLSAIPDIARPLMVHGMRPFGKALAGMATEIDRLPIVKAELRRMGVALEMVFNHRARALAELDDVVTLGTRADQTRAAITDNFAKLTGMQHWNDGWKTFAGVMSMDRMLTSSAKLAKGGKLGRSDLQMMTRSGIDEGMAKRIAEQFAKHGEPGQINLARTHLWDEEVASAFENAIRKQVDEIIVTPGLADRPLIGSTEAGKLVFQFKSFAFSATNRMLFAGLQQKDLAFMSGLLSSVALGAAVYVIKNKVAGREVDYTPAKLLAEAIDRSGALGILTEFNNIAEKATRGTVGINPMIASATGQDVPMMSRYASRNVWGALLGPAAGTVEDTFKVSGALATGEWSAGDVSAARKMLPYQNLFYIRGIFNQLEDKLAEELVE